MIVISNGKNTHPTTSDRCFNYGDGCFTTILLKDSKPVLLSSHIARLKKACDVLVIDGIDWQSLTDELNQCQQSDPLAICKVHISRGQGGRGYHPGVGMEPIVYISVFPYVEHYLTWQQQGISLGVSSVRLGLNPMLAGLKHCNRIEQVMIKQRLVADGLSDVEDVLVADIKDNVVEASASNVFYRLKGQWYTPAMIEAGVQGVVRDMVLAQSANAAKERCLQLNELQHVEAMVLTNALMMAIPVNTLRYQNQQLSLDFAVANQFAIDIRGLYGCD